MTEELSVEPTIVWGHSALQAVFLIDDRFAVSLLSVGHPGLYVAKPPIPPLPAKGALVQPLLPLPLVEIFATGNGHVRAGSKMVDSVVGGRLRYVSHRVAETAAWTTLEIDQLDAATGMTVTTVLRSPVGVASVTATVTIANPSDASAPVSLEFVGVAALFGAAKPSEIDDIDLIFGENEWLAEGRWTRGDLRAAGIPDLNLTAHPTDPKGARAFISTGSWSTGHFMPMGMLVDRVVGTAWAFEVEHNGPWHWEVGERRDGAYVLLSGPNDRDHQWNRLLTPGESFTSVPVTIARGDSFDGAVATLTTHRRRARREHPDNTALPLVFNDYMNTLMGDPTTEKLLPLIDAAASVGAEIFCVDAGWYDDTGEWWDGVGEWMPSTTRFPGGLGEVLDHIRGAGMVPGLWLEPEVIGVNSVMATRLPNDAFLQRHGIRVREHDRFHLDLRHPAAVAHLDSVVDRIVGDYGVGYIKLDYNIDAGPGTDRDTDSVGTGLLDHNRAHLAWLDGVHQRHPALVLENCSSGAMRMDQAMLSRLQLQSTTDQQDPVRYPPIAAAAPLSMVPEQAANWAYPQPGMASEEAAYTLCTALLERFYLSGHINKMEPAVREIVAEAVTAHKLLRPEIRVANPVWPLGFPGWDDQWLALGLETAEATLLTVWRRFGAGSSTDIPLPALRGRNVTVETVFPNSLAPWGTRWDAAAGVLHLDADNGPASARTFRIH